MGALHRHAGRSRGRKSTHDVIGVGNGRAVVALRQHSVTGVAVWLMIRF